MDEYVAVASQILVQALEVMNVDLLLKRLKVMGMLADLIKLLMSWLNDRASYVKVDRECSAYFLLQEGTVKGSVLGLVSS